MNAKRIISNYDTEKSPINFLKTEVQKIMNKQY